MVIGLGHGSTARIALRRVAELLHTGELHDIVAIPCSNTAKREARRLGIPLTSLEEHPVIDLTIDGADEVAPNLDLIKGRGGALLREKIVSQASRREIIIVDEAKLSPALGTLASLPVEVIPFGLRCQSDYLEGLGAEVMLRRRKDDRTFKTDQGNLLLDCRFGPIADPPRLAALLEARAGIVGHGLFLGIGAKVIVGASRGVRQLEANENG